MPLSRIASVVELTCLECNHSNLSDANFCSACGAGLLRRLCPGCHVANSVGAQYCQACGFHLPVPPDAESLDPLALATPPVLNDVVAAANLEAYVMTEIAAQAPVQQRSLRLAMLCMGAVVGVLVAGVLMWSLKSKAPVANPSEPATAAVSAEGDTSQAQAATPPSAQPATTTVASDKVGDAHGGAATLSNLPAEKAAEALAAAAARASEPTAASGTASGQAQAAPKPVAATAPSGVAPAPKPTVAATPSPRTPKPKPPTIECTANAQALGLCEP